MTQESLDDTLLTIREQGSFAVGGMILRDPGMYHPAARSQSGQTLHGDHAHVFYQIPAKPRRFPLVFLHGNLQFSKTWSTTPDGREGFQNIFLRRHYSVYLVDQPRRGNAGRSTLPGTYTATPEDQRWYNTFRVGIWPDYFPGVQFSQSPDALDQFFRQITPDTGPFDISVVADSIVALFDRIGPAVLVSHSKGGGVSWLAAVNSPNIRAVISYEPGSNFLFPENEVPADMESSAGTLKALGVPMDEFLKLTRIPIVLFYGDYIPEERVDNPGQDQWRVRRAMARLWTDAVNRHGGDAQLVCLPEIGIEGNTHFPFSDLNNLEIADLMSAFLKDKGLD